MPIPGYRIATKLAGKIPLGSGKLARSVAGRRDAVERWERWASTERTDGPLLWVHAASVGEGLAVEPVTRRLLAAVPRIQIVHTYSSPSAAGWPGSFGAHSTGYLPLDEPRSVGRVLDALEPSLMLFSRGDIWPELATQAAQRGLPLAVSGAAVRPTSHRLHFPVRMLLRQFYDSIVWLGAVSHADAVRCQILGVRPAVIRVTGDPRHDRILERVPRVQPLQQLSEWRQTANVMIAGSTHPKDEIVVLDAFCSIQRSDPSSRLIVVPHEPSGKAIAAVMDLASKRGTRTALWDGSSAAPAADCLLVTAKGILPDLYAIADMAYVGGGFRRGLLHSTAEAAAYAIPIVVGPHYDNANDAVQLVELDGAAVLTTTSPAEQLHRVWLEWIDDPARRVATGLAARQTLQAGAAARTVQGILPLLPTQHIGGPVSR